MKRKKNVNQYGGGRRKSKKLVLILMTLLLVIIAAIAVAIFLLLNQVEKVSAKAKFFEYFAQSNLNEVFELEAYNNLAQIMSKESFSSNTDVGISISTDDFKLDNIDVVLDIERDNENNKTHAAATLNYSENELLDLEVLTDNEEVAVNLDGVTDGYIGASYDYLVEELLEEIGLGMNPLLPNSALEMPEEIENLNLPKISNASMDIYKNILDKNLKEEQFSTKEVTLNRKTGNIKATEYCLKMSLEELKVLMTNVLQAFETDTETLEQLENGLSSMGISGDDIVSYIEEFLAQIDEMDLDTSASIAIKVYVSDGKTVKLLVEAEDYTLVEIEYEYAKSENSIKITQVNALQTGTTTTFKNTNSDLAQKMRIEQSKIVNGEIILTITVDTNIVSSGNNYTVNANVSCKDEERTVSIKSVSEIKVDDVDLTDLELEDCTFLQDLSKEELEEKLNKIYENGQKFLTEKLLQLSFIDANSGSVFIEQNSDDEEDENQSAKEEAKQALILAVQHQMDIAYENGEDYTIQDLDGLEIDGYEVNVELSRNLAVVTVDGYVFNIDSNFELSE